jgi:hypothetical protein
LDVMTPARLGLALLLRLGVLAAPPATEERVE